MSYVKVYKYKKQYSLDGGVTWQDVTPAEYVPSGDPIGYYDTYEECIAQYRTIQSGTTCVGVDKHNQDVYEVSYDNGVTWSVVSTSAGTLIEANSYDCGYRTRTTSGTAYCTGYDKYVDVYSQVSTDYGNTWTTTATTPTLVELNSEDCGYVPPFEGKYKLTLNDSSTVSAECDASSAVTQNEVSTLYKNTLVSAVIGNCIKTIDYGTFINCTGLTNVYIPDNVETINRWAFNFCYNLSTIKIPSSVTNIGDTTFHDCRSLTSITVDSNNSVYDSRNNCNAIIETSTNTLKFGCNNTIIPNTVTSIYITAFGGCGITNIFIPDSVTSIGEGAFQRCSGLTSVTVEATTPPTLGSRAFNDSTCPIYVPAASVNTYKSASGWSTYASRIQAIP